MQVVMVRGRIRTFTLCRLMVVVVMVFAIAAAVLLVKTGIRIRRGLGDGFLRPWAVAVTSGIPVSVVVAGVAHRIFGPRSAHKPRDTAMFGCFNEGSC
jgi:uncharacterized PurR-regulated membrane protein YhhQ (DUF165 family)